MKRYKDHKMSDFIGFPEILGGRIKSIDPKLLGGGFWPNQVTKNMQKS